jgi:hypothetical protein
MISKCTSIPSMTIVLFFTSLPTLGVAISKKMFSINLVARDVFPTLESPIMIILSLYFELDISSKFY